MAGKSKSKPTHYTNDTKYDETKGIKYTTDYKFEIGSKCKYVGGMYDNVKGKIGIITKRANNKHRIDYSVRFDNVNGIVNSIEINCILEKVLELVETVNENNVLEEIINENN